MINKTLLVDKYGRDITYLRISVTDRCNLRCVYCMPLEGIKYFNKTNILTFEEMERFSKIAVNLGVRKIKITGGEPLVRKGIVNFIYSLKKIKGIDDISITTNGNLLEEMIYDLKDAGLQRINVSVDSLDSERYTEITRGGDLNKVKKGINKALENGLRIKINTVVLKDLTEDEIITLIEFGNESGIEVRFIEFMPLCGNGGNNEYFVPISIVKEKIEKRYDIKYMGNNGITDRYSIDGGGTIGFITTMSEPFCSTCSRLRLTARGTLRPCLFSNLEVNIFKLLREERPDEVIESAIRKSVYIKPKWNPVLSGYEDPKKIFIRNVGG